MQSPSLPRMPSLSVVIPVFNERGNIGPLVQEVVHHLRGKIAFDIICVDDRSDDDTREVLGWLKAEVSELRVLLHHQRSGQSTAIRNGVKHALSPWIATLDGDGQNDPADGPGLVDALKAGPPDLVLVGGERVKRQDSAAKKFASKFGNGVRKRLLKDTANDTGCGLKAFRRDAFLRLPYFDHIHRYLPALMLREGYQVDFRPVNHRHRQTGQSKYTNLGRLWASASDLFGVMWLQSRSRLPGAVEEL